MSIYMYVYHNIGDKVSEARLDLCTLRFGIGFPEHGFVSLGLVSL